MANHENETNEIKENKTHEMHETNNEAKENKPGHNMHSTHSAHKPHKPKQKAVHKNPQKKSGGVKKETGKKTLKIKTAGKKEFLNTVQTNSFLQTIKIILIILLTLLVLYNAVKIYGLNKETATAVAKINEIKAPAKISLTAITTPTCTNCFDIDAAVKDVKTKKLEIINEQTLEYGSKEAQTLIDKYAIKKVPTIIVTGEIDKAKLLDFVKKDDALLFNKLTPPYLDSNTGKELGNVKLTLLKDSTCKDCTDWTPVVSQLQSRGIAITEIKNVERTSEEGKQLIAKYSIKKLPTLIFSSDFGEYADMMDAWTSVGTKDKDGSYVLREVSPPYYDVQNDQITGLVNVIYLTDKSCKECYDTQIHKTILLQLGVKIAGEEQIDIASDKGKELIKEYSITSVPTIILSKEVDAYTNFKKVWASVGTKEKDGSYVFRKIDAMTDTKYKDLTTGTVKG